MGGVPLTSYGRAVLACILSAAVLTLLTSCAQDPLTPEEKLADFKFLLDTLRDNHAYLALKARVEGYDLLQHEAEWKQAVAATKNDREFGEVIGQMLSSVNNGHSYVASAGTLKLVMALPDGMKPWKGEAAKTDPKTANKWHGFANASQMSADQAQLPFRTRYVQGKYYVYWAAPGLLSAGVTPGCYVDSVDGVPAPDFVRSLRGKTHLLYDPYRKSLFTTELRLPDDSRQYHLVFRDTEGRAIQADIRLSDWKDSRIPFQVMDLPHGIPNLYGTILEGGKVGYLRVSQMAWSSEGSRTLRDFFAKARDLPSLIIDIRGNSGGDGTLWIRDIVRPLASSSLTWSSAGAARKGEQARCFLAASTVLSSSIEGLSVSTATLGKDQLRASLPPEDFANLPPEILTDDFGDISVTTATLSPSGEHPYSGNVYLLVDRNVYSAAESFAQFCKSTGWATVVGEFTGGGAGGDPALVTLPNSRMAVVFPYVMALNSDFSANEEAHTMPDHYVEQTSADLVEYARALESGSVGDQPAPAYDSVLRECLRLATK